MLLPSRLAAALWLAWMAILPGTASPAETAPAETAPAETTPAGVQVHIELDEAEAALAIRRERRETGSVKPESWDRLWKTQGFKRLRKRQESFGAKEVEKGFRDFLTSDETLARLDALRAAAEAWKR